MPFALIGVSAADAVGAQIPVERILGPVLAICGGQDELWPSCSYSEQITARLDEHHDPFRHRQLSYPDAGHGVDILLPNLPTGGTETSSPLGTLYLGGSPVANALARQDAWPQLLSFLTTSE
ncbi:MAG TPA: acyl-CoA thioester hydrolase/BAAT C-terminal domain-containing protein [Mycobacteriales bacterium]|nr:acyl-CoA thioester hydrolase/BAAT C-terminal domain-containing protein [Mycobacteriales bacterium]